MASEQKNDLYSGIWPSDPKNYQWKGTLSVHNSTWNVLAHCKPRKEDVFIKIKQTQDHDSDIDQFTENTKNLINIQHKNLLTPVHAFVHKSEIWVVYPRHSGGPLIEVLTSHYPNGIPDESIVSCILYDICSGLQNLHKQQQCHRNIRASSLHIDIDNGQALLTEFGELKEIKWKHAAGRRNTFVSPEREPFTDPLILLGDEDASWYAGDIYAFGITALQVTYGNTPPLNIKNILQQKSMNISTDLYDKKCPFSKAFETMIRDCCANKLQNRISINKLMEHKFFSKKAEHTQIKQYFGHILKSTEKRINSSLSAPQSFNYNGLSQNSVKNDENLDENKVLDYKVGNGMKIEVESNGNAIGTNNNNNNAKLTDKKVQNSADWSFSTSLRKSELDLKVGQLQNGLSNSVSMDTPTVTQWSVDTPTVGPDMETYLSPQHHPTMHNANVTQGNSYNDPSQQHEPPINQPIVGKKTRNYHVSFSESESQSLNEHNMTDIHHNNTDSGGMNNNTVQINRFKVEFGSRGSRASESGTVATQIEPSETNDEEIDVTEFDPHGDDTDEEHTQHDSTDNQQTIQIKRFHITPAKPEVSADECDENVNNVNNNNNANPNNNNNINNNNVSLQQSSEQKETEEDKYIPPSVDKTKWSKQQLAEWVGSFGSAFNPYVKAFDENGINGDFMGIVTDDDLKEIVPSNLHRKRILTAWKKLQQNNVQQ